VSNQAEWDDGTPPKVPRSAVAVLLMGAAVLGVGGYALEHFAGIHWIVVMLITGAVIYAAGKPLTRLLFRALARGEESRRAAMRYKHGTRRMRRFPPAAG
jgi:hypothetical protein